MRLNRFLIFAVLLTCQSVLVSHADPATPSPGALKIDPTFVDLKQMTFAGIATYATPQSGQFPALWDNFTDAIGDYAGLDTGTYSYGLELYPPSFAKTHKFTYMAACTVSDPAKVSMTLVTRTVPASRYAVFSVPGGLKGVGDAMRYIYMTWLPSSNYMTAYPYDFERYDASPAAVKDGIMTVEILVPIKDRNK